MKNKIKMFFHCKDCGGGHPAVGWTDKGVQVWCETCDQNILHLDFMGQKVKYADDEEQPLKEINCKCGLCGEDKAMVDWQEEFK